MKPPPSGGFNHKGDSMNTPADDLKNILYQLTLGTSDDPSGGYHEDSSRLDFLTLVVRGLEVGDYSYEEAKLIFAQDGPAGFDFEQWFGQQVEAGHYNDPT